MYSQHDRKGCNKINRRNIWRSMRRSTTAGMVFRRIHVVRPVSMLTLQKKFDDLTELYRSVRGADNWGMETLTVGRTKGRGKDVV